MLSSVGLCTMKYMLLVHFNFCNLYFNCFSFYSIWLMFLILLVPVDMMYLYRSSVVFSTYFLDSNSVLSNFSVLLFSISSQIILWYDFFTYFSNWFYSMVLFSFYCGDDWLYFSMECSLQWVDIVIRDEKNIKYYIETIWPMELKSGSS